MGTSTFSGHRTRRTSSRAEAAGRPRDAAKTLGISVNTVCTQFRAVCSKPGVQSRVQLANALRELGALD
jgi:hypothetical protein